MKKILRNHSSSVFAALAIVFLAVIVVAYAWGISYLIFKVGKANSRATANGQAPQFNLDAAAKLDYRGVSTSTNVGALQPPQ